MNHSVDRMARPAALAAGRTVKETEDRPVRQFGTAGPEPDALPPAADPAGMAPFPAAEEDSRAVSLQSASGPAHTLRRRHDLVLACTALACGLSRRALVHAGRDRQAAIVARHMAMYILHVVFSVPMAEVARLFRRDRSTVAYACRRIEEEREDARFDAFMHDLELAISTLDSAMQMYPGAFSMRTNHE